MDAGEAALRAELGELRARVIRLERRLNALGVDTPDETGASDGSRPPGGGGALLDALGEGFEALSDAFKG